MGLFGRLRRRRVGPPPNRQSSVILEVTTRCNLRCRYCYNVWNGRAYPREELDTASMRRLITRICAQTGCDLLTFTGGEPLLREDLEDLVAHTRKAGVGVNLITNGALIDAPRAVALVEAGVGLFETPLLGSERRLAMDLHGDDALAATQEAILLIREAGGEVVTAFVATARNIAQALDAAEISFALGAAGMMFNRFNPGGRGCREADALMPPPDTLAEALAALDRFVEETGFPVSCSIPIHPCILDVRPFGNLSFGSCAAATPRAYYTVDPMGRLRMCNHSPGILGDLMEEDFSVLTAPSKVGPFIDPVPDDCVGCLRLSECRCGCRAGAESCYGTVSLPDPYLRRFGTGPILEESSSSESPGSRRPGDVPP
ncbi:MAG: radical SAM protein [Pseudomonadota bacterium]